MRALSTEYRIAEERFHKLNNQKLISLAFQKRAQDEVNLYKVKNAAEKSFRWVWFTENLWIWSNFKKYKNSDQLSKRINEQENIGKNLKDKQKSLKDVSVDGTKQVKLWKDMLRLMEMKRQLAMVSQFFYCFIFEFY